MAFPRVVPGLRLSILAITAILLLTFPAFGQRPTGSPSGGSVTTGSSGPLNGSGNNPYSTSTSTSSNGGAMARPIFLSGKVVFDDGTAPNSDIRIVRTCGSDSQLQVHTDSKGRFSFQMGNTTIAADDASDSSGGPLGRVSSAQASSSKSLTGTSIGSAYWNCDVHATYPGYRSDMVSLSMRHSLDDPDIGTIILHRLANVQGSTISLTSALAPKHAQKEYEKGVKLAQQGKLDEAENHFKEATDTYPKFAVAWFALGEAQQSANKTEEARKSFLAAIQADSRFVSPYDQLALAAARAGNWKDAAEMSGKVISLNPVEFPSAFWYNAMANYQLKKKAEAEKSAKELLKVDSRHQYPQAESLLAQISLDRHDYSDAAAHLRAYLGLAPNAKDAEHMREALKRIEDATPPANPAQ